MTTTLFGYEITIKRARKKDLFLPNFAQNIHIEKNELHYEFSDGTPHILNLNCDHARIDGIQSHFSDTQKRIAITMYN